MSGRKSEAVESEPNTISFREHEYVPAMVSGERGTGLKTEVLFEKRFPGSEETIAIKLVWAGDG